MRVVSRRSLRVRQGGEELPVRLQITGERVFHVIVLMRVLPLLRRMNDRGRRRPSYAQGQNMGALPA